MNTTIIPQETSVALISGGKSGEREISLVSGSAVYDALSDAGFSVTQDRKSTRLNSSHGDESRMPSSA